MAWHMADQPPTQGLSDPASPYTTPISKSDLQPGDILVDNVGEEHHAVIFQGWNDNAKTSAQVYSFGGTPVQHYTDVSLTSGYIGSHLSTHYSAFRYQGGKIVDSATGVSVAEDVTTSAQPVLRVFFRGADGALWQYYYTGGSWISQQIGGYMLDNPAVLMDGSTVRVFFEGTDGALWQYYYAGGTWTMQRIGGDFDSGFSAAWYNGVIHVFGRGSGPGSLYQYYYSGGTWNLQSLGGQISSAPGADFDGTMLRAFARGADGSLYQDYWDGSAWHWQYIGGQVA
jgi:hypothetical protein